METECRGFDTPALSYWNSLVSTPRRTIQRFRQRRNRQFLEIITKGSQEQGICVHIVIAPNLPKVRGNEENYKECLTALLKNSLEATSALRLTHSNGHVVIEVKDTGRDNGTGIGLGMVRKLIKEMGGELVLKSQPGQGTCFTLMLPAVLGLDVESRSSGQHME